MTEPQPHAEPFEGVVGRGSVDYAIRTTQQELVALNGQADVKASIMITACSIAITGALIGAERTWPGALLTMAGFAVPALLLAILAVVPKYRAKKPPERINVVFFGHFGFVSRQEYLAELARACADDKTLYRVLGGNLWELGRALETHKYRYLRLSYLVFFVGAVVALGVETIHSLA